MLAYQGPISKRKLLSRIDAHAKADRLDQGTYGAMNGAWRGCAVSCSLVDADGKLPDGTLLEDGRHDLYPELLGIPEQLAYLEDAIFEALPSSQAMEWPRRFAKAIPDGADLSLVWPRFAVWLLVDPENGVGPDDEHCQAVAGLYRRVIAGEDVPDAEFSRAARAAGAAWHAGPARAVEAARAAGVARAARAADKLCELLAEAPVAEVAS